MKKSLHLLVTVLVISLLLSNASSAHASGRCYVDTDATGNNNGEDWANAYTDLQDAIADTCTEIWVAEGIYTPHASDREVSFEIENGTAIYGGFDGAETLLYQRDPAVHVTTLSGDLGSNDAGFNNNSENSHRVVVANFTDPTTILDGFTIRGGNANGNFPYNAGGGIYTQFGSPTLRNLVITENSGEFGGGMHSDNASSPRLTGVLFHGNQATDRGGGMDVDIASPILVDVTFYDNSATNTGGGIYTSGSGTSLTKVTFKENTALSGGGMYNYSSTPTLVNVTFSGNSATNGGGMFNFQSSLASLMNVTLSGNHAGFAGGGMYNSSSDLTATNTILWGNTADNSGAEVHNLTSAPIISYSIVQGSGGSTAWDTALGVDGGGNLDADPLLGALQDNGGATETMALGAGSSAIDKGTNSGCPATDQRGISRISDGDKNGTSTCDIGAYEVPVLTVKSIAAQDGWVLESSETSNTGGSLNKNSTTLRIGDDGANKQYRAILSFNTSTLPDEAVITAVTLKIKHAGKTGLLPFGSHGNLLVDIKNGFFGSSSLQVSDFDTKPSKSNAFHFTNSKLNNWYIKSIGAANFTYVNKTGSTQFRLRFTTDDNNNSRADYLKIYSGNAGAANRPQLIVEYYIP